MSGTGPQTGTRGSAHGLARLEEMQLPGPHPTCTGDKFPQGFVIWKKLLMEDGGVCPPSLHSQSERVDRWTDGGQVVRLGREAVNGELVDVMADGWSCG